MGIIKNKPKRQTTMDTQLAITLSRRIQQDEKGNCPEMEKISLLVEGRLTGEDRDTMMTHLSSCRDCYETFLLTTELYQKSQKVTNGIRQPIRFRPLALAASALIVVVSLIVLYKTGSIEKSWSPLPEKSESEKSISYAKGDSIHDETRAFKRKSGKKINKKAMAREEGKGPEDKKKLKTSEIEDQDQPAQPKKGKPPVEQTEFRTQEKTRAGERAITQAKKNREEIIGEEKQPLSEKKEAGLKPTRVVSRYQNGNIKTVHLYSRRGNEIKLEEIQEFDLLGRNTLIKNPVKNSLIKMGYYPDGNRKFREEYLNRTPHGTWIKWNPQGEIIEKQIYKNGILIKKIN